MSILENKYYWWQKFLPPAILSIITFIFYYPSLIYGYFFDDYPTILENLNILRDSHNYKSEIFSSGRWISRFLNKFTYYYWQINPFAYRIFNLLIHIASGILIFFLVLKLLGNLKKDSFIKTNAYIISIITCGLFLLHPVQSQTVTYISQMRVEGLVVFFTLLVLITFVNAVRSENIFIKVILYLFSLVLTYVSVGTKEIIIVLPLLILLVDWFFLAQGDFKKFISRIFVHIVFISCFIFSLSVHNKKLTQAVVTHSVVTSSEIVSNRGNVITEKPGEEISIYTYFISQFKVNLHYLKIYFLPFNLTFDYDVKLSNSIFNFDVLGPLLILLILFFVCLYLFIKDKNNIYTFCFLWFFITILPRASFIRSNELICDYKTYISSFGAMLFIAILLTYLFVYLVKYLNNLIKLKYKFNYNFIILFIFFIFLGFTTKTRNLVWSSELAFWQDAVKKSPNKARLYNNLGVCYAEKGDVNNAIESYKKACELDPNYAEPVINLGMNYHAMGKKDIAWTYYEKALNLKEIHPELYYSIGRLHFEDRNYAKAELCFTTALQLKPYYSYAHFDLARTYQEQGKIDLALQHYKLAQQGDKNHVDFYYNYAALCLQVRRFDEAIENLNLILKNYNNYKDTLFLLSACYYEKHDYLNASNILEKIYNIDQKNLSVAYNYAMSLLNSKQYDKALNIYEKCKADLNNFPFTILHIAKCRAMLGRKALAKRELLADLQKMPFANVKQDGQVLLREIS